MSAYFCTRYTFDLLAAALERYSHRGPIVQKHHLHARHTPESIGERYGAAVLGGLELSRGRLFVDPCGFAGRLTVARLLAEENRLSMTYRYPDVTGTDEDRHMLATGRDRLDTDGMAYFNHFQNWQVASVADGYEFQSCERPDYEDSPAHELLTWLRHGMLRHAFAGKDGPRDLTADYITEHKMSDAATCVLAL